MSSISHFLLHTLVGRVTLIVLFLVLSLLIASLAGWLPELS
ncbi:MAG TPA: hypothetical protein VLK65_10515 [Vicinamibacteria bacterium]|nr:hypothetical protein [Vicinamibacteria bacterium]